MSLVGLYHALPGPLKSVAASLHGLGLARQRYGPETAELVAAARERESWPPPRWALWQEQRLAELLPAWAALAAQRGREGAKTHLQGWPVLDKQNVRADPAGFRIPDEAGSHHAERTSGSTGTPLVVWWSPAATRGWYALVEARLRGWHGISRRDRWAILGGRLVAAPRRTRPPYWVWNAAMHQLYLSSYHLSRDSVAAYLDALGDYEVRSILGYPSALGALASLALDAGLKGPKLDVVLTNAEPLSALQRAQIAAVFGCPVRDSYGLAELVAAGSECEAGAMHLWPEVGLVEILDEADQPVAAGQVGRLVATGLLNNAMALVRYDTGDLAALDPDPRPCGCGRALPRLLALEGRRDAVIVTPDGRHIGRLDPAFKADLPIREAQVAQVARDRVDVRVVPGTGWNPTHAAVLAAAVGDRLGPTMAIGVVCVETLPRTAAGKVRGVVIECSENS